VVGSASVKGEKLMNQQVGSSTTFHLIFFFLQLRGPATSMGTEFLHDLTTARHFKSIL
jgi:hypothetical protein